MLDGTPTPMICGHPECGQPATVQWARRGTDVEAWAWARGQRQQQVDVNDYQRTAIALEIDELETKLDKLQDVGATPAVVDMFQRALQERRETLDSITDPAEPLTPAPVMQAVFACDTHKVTDDAAAQTHDTDCFKAGTCGCSL
jgi:hypothetical protein